MSRPDLDAILRPLKPFQRRTVDHAFHRLFLAPDSTHRFLVADEVGLGKTLVARGIIGRAINHLWDDVGRIDIIYICSNSSIARANLPKLQVGAHGHRSVALATRLTMLVTELAPRDGEPGLAASKLNFVSFTPNTSIYLGNSGGQAKEREVLFHLLDPVIGRQIPLMNLLQCGISRTDHWRWRIKNCPVPLDDSIRARFQQAFQANNDLQTEMEDLLTTWFQRRRKRWPAEARMRRNRLIGDLRQLLAGICVDALEPDLVILDEFQRFKPLLESREEFRDPAASLAQALFRAQTPEGQPVRTLLLSATPYKLYTADAEIEHEDHYEDFLATTRFLMNEDESRVQDLKVRLSSFGAALKRVTHGDTGRVVEAKARVEAALGAVMARTERVSASDQRDAMIEESAMPISIDTSDIKQYLAADAMFHAVGDRDPMPYWKSAPYLAHFMRGYKVNERIEETLENSPEKVARVLLDHDASFLKAAEIRAWSKIESGNAKLRELSVDLLDGGLWQMLWMPATVPYWPPGVPFEGQDRVTKSLLFSAWNLVPDVVSAVLSYEAERRMMGGELESYLEPNKQQVPLLRLSQSAIGTRSRHRLLLLMLPCLALSDKAHPLCAPSGIDRRDWVRSQIDIMLADQRLPNPEDGDVDDRWEWAAPLLLDPDLREFLVRWRNDDSLPRPNPELFADYVEDFLALDRRDLGRRPDGLAELLTEVALGAPAVLAARTMASARLEDDDRRAFSVILAEAFWRLFNRPAVICLLEQLSKKAVDTTREEAYYWRLVLRYCQDGNLQAVLDETWHLVREQYAWSEDQDATSVGDATVRQIAQVVQPVPARVHAQFFSVNDESIERDEIRLRTAFALRFGDLRTDERVVSQEALREAFNSPFRPFVLASTSVGQEGLDFHPWCHRLVHWNLPGNPVDLEQREGRVHRYKGHAVRRNVAIRHHDAAIARWQFGEDLWGIIFELAETQARESGESDLVPYWISTGPYRVQRRVPLLPYTTEVLAFQQLKRQLAAYRVVFGQPRQEELLTLLDHANLDLASLNEWTIDLSPLTAPGSDLSPRRKRERNS